MKSIVPFVLFLAGCSSSSAPAAIDSGPPPTDSPVEAAGDAAAPEAGPDAPDAQDGQPEAAEEAGDDGGPTDAGRPDVIPIGSDGAACQSPPPGDGGTFCVLYAYQVDGGPLDEAGHPNGISVTMACTPGQDCTACIGGYGYGGVCF